MREVSSAILDDVTRYTSNPLAMFPIRKRLALEWPEVLKNITNCSIVHDYPGTCTSHLTNSKSSCIVCSCKNTLFQP